MCGRFTLRAELAAIADWFSISQPAVAWTPRFNIAPTQSVLAIRYHENFQARKLVPLRWGLIPFWAKDQSIGNRLINARAETVAEKPSFRQAFRRRRCVVVADGYYEWCGTKQQKQPYLIEFSDHRIFGIAALWESWKDATETELETVTLITTEANTQLQAVHHRMPALLDAVDFPVWLGETAASDRQMLELLGPFAGQEFKIQPVSKWVNRPSNEGVQCLQPPADVPDALPFTE